MPVNAKTSSKSVKKTKVSKKSKVAKVAKVTKTAKVAKVAKAKVTVKTSQKAGAKSVTKKSSVKKVVSKKVVAAEVVTKPVRKVRSFKVKLPGSETYLGRFTGLTPYQAANKALSKYYREEDKPDKQITFSIKESTRGSKRGTYAYNGRREKLKVPVEYAIKDGRVITKNFKNKLHKIKKAELATLNLVL